MTSWLDSNGVRVVAYLAIASASFVAGARELRRRRDNPSLWPTFWFLTGALFLLMGVGRAGNLAELAADLGRQEAISAGWYDHRRKYQAMVVGAVAGAWFVSVLVALWRVPERRRRYLPMTLLSVTIVCFAGIRTVSLHQVDGLLYRRYLHGVRIGIVVELGLLVLAFVLTLWRLPRRQPTSRRASSPAEPQTIGQG